MSARAVTEQQAHEEPAAIMAVLERWCHVDGYSQPFYALRAKHLPYGPYTFDMTVKPDMDQMGPDATAREVRAVFLNRAEDALDALEAAGWHLTQYPCMEFRGEVRPFAQFLSGKLAEPSRQGGIELRMRLAVDRPR